MHWVDHGGPAGAPVLVCVHGLGGSLLNWAAVAPSLARDHRVVALDLPGFGRSHGAGRPTSVRANRRVLHRFLADVVGEPVVLVGNSMGGTITAIQTAREPDTVRGLVLLNPALPVRVLARPDPAVLTSFTLYASPAGRAVLSRWRRLRTPEQTVYDMLRLCCADPSRVPHDVVRLHIAAARERRDVQGIDADFLAAARSLLWTIGRRRHYAELLARIRPPVLLLHGTRDRLVPIQAARAAARANPSWRFEVAHGVGHVPQLEAPQWTAATIRQWLADEVAAPGAPAAHGRT